jgi:hypothetical protein
MTKSMVKHGLPWVDGRLIMLGSQSAQAQYMTIGWQYTSAQGVDILCHISMIRVMLWRVVRHDIGWRLKHTAQGSQYGQVF